MARYKRMMNYDVFGQPESRVAPIMEYVERTYPGVRSYSLHQRARQLRCHHCDHREPIPFKCPDCGNQDLTTV